jgi:hypothetical protein
MEDRYPYSPEKKKVLMRHIKANGSIKAQKKVCILFLKRKYTQSIQKKNRPKDWKKQVTRNVKGELIDST